MWNNNDRMDTWAWSSMLVLSIAMTMPLLWYAKRLTEAVEAIAENKEENMLRA